MLERFKNAVNLLRGEKSPETNSPIGERAEHLGNPSAIVNLGDPAHPHVLRLREWNPYLGRNFIPINPEYARHRWLRGCDGCGYLDIIEDVGRI